MSARYSVEIDGKLEAVWDSRFEARDWAEIYKRKHPDRTVEVLHWGSAETPKAAPEEPSEGDSEADAEGS